MAAGCVSLGIAVVQLLKLWSSLAPPPGFTPLHMAAGYMHTGSMTVLLEAGANPEIKVGRGGGEALGFLSG